MAKKNELGRPVIWRHHMSGVWIGWISESKVPNHIRLEGRRIRSWRGGRDDCSSLSQLGARDSDTLTERVKTDISIEGSVEITDTSHENVMAAMELP